MHARNRQSLFRPDSHERAGTPPQQAVARRTHPHRPVRVAFEAGDFAQRPAASLAHLLPSFVLQPEHSLSIREPHRALGILGKSACPARREIWRRPERSELATLMHCHAHAAGNPHPSA